MSCQSVSDFCGVVFRHEENHRVEHRHRYYKSCCLSWPHRPLSLQFSSDWRLLRQALLWVTDKTGWGSPSNSMLCPVSLAWIQREFTLVFCLLDGMDFLRLCSEVASHQVGQWKTQATLSGGTSKSKSYNISAYKDPFCLFPHCLCSTENSHFSMMDEWVYEWKCLIFVGDKRHKYLNAFLTACGNEGPWFLSP